MSAKERHAASATPLPRRTADRAVDSASDSASRLIGMLRWVQVTQLVDFMIIMPLGWYFIRAFGMSASGLGGLVFAYTVSAGVAGVIVGSIIDRFERRRMLLTVYSVFLLSLLLTASAGSFSVLLGARILAGLSGGVLSALIQTMIADAVPLAQRAAAIGRVMTGHALAAVIGVPLGLALASALGWHSPFVVLALIATLVLYGVWRRVPTLPRERAAGGPSSALRLFAHGGGRRFVAAFLLTFTVTCSAYAIVAYIAPYWVGNVGVSEEALPLVYLFAGALTYFTSPFTGRLADRHGRTSVFMAATLLSIIAIFIVTHASRLPLWLALPLGSGFFVIIYARWIPAVALLTEVPPAASRGAFMMLNGVVTQLSMGLGALFTGAVVTYAPDGSLRGFETVGYAAMALSLTAIFLARSVARVAERNLGSRER